MAPRHRSKHWGPASPEKNPSNEHRNESPFEAKKEKKKKKKLTSNVSLGVRFQIEAADEGEAGTQPVEVNVCQCFSVYS